MSANNLGARIGALIDGAAAVAGRIAPLVTRLAIGSGFVMTGLGKWRHLDATTAFFEGAGIPAPAANAVLVATLELVGGALLILGVLTRTMALLLASTMVVAVLTADRGAFLSVLGGGRPALDVAALTYLILLLWLAGRGPGALSVAALLANRTGRSAMSCRLDAAKV